MYFVVVSGEPGKQRHGGNRGSGKRNENPQNGPQTRNRNLRLRTFWAAQSFSLGEILLTLTHTEDVIKWHLHVPRSHDHVDSLHVHWEVSTLRFNHAMGSPSPLRLTVLMPLRDDWTSAAELIRRLEKIIPASSCAMEILLIDDASEQECDHREFEGDFSVVRSVRTVRLARNLGHQRAIAIGLVQVRQAGNCDAVAVMDADGEDTPEGLAQLLKAYSETGRTTAIFAERNRRSESVPFRFFYRLYKLLHLFMTGISVRVGNFSILPASYLNTLVVMSELWNHYAAAVFRSKMRFTMIPIPRGTRIAGTSRMNFVALVSHGLSAMSVFGDIVGVRLLVAALAGSLLAVLGIVVVASIRLFTSLAIPGWATYAAGSLAIIAIQLITIAASFTFFVLSNRTNLGFVPLRDYSLFVEKTVEIYSYE